MGRWGWSWRPGASWTVPLDAVGSATLYAGQAGAYGSHIPDPLPEGQPPEPEHRDNRPRYYPEIPGDYRGRPAVRRPYLTPPTADRLPIIPDGTLIRLDPGEWSHQAGLDPSEQVVMRVSAVHPDLPCADVGMVWVTGHGIACSWPSSTCVRPCYELLVSVEALRRVGGR